MIEVKVCASSANLGPGFDCLAIALNLYNTFLVKESDELLIEGCPEEFQNEDNLFYRGYKAVADRLGVKSFPNVKIEADIPIARGLGSSSSMIVGGLVSANYLLGNKLSDEELLEMASIIEGHPDNVAACIYGSLCLAIKDESEEVINLKVDNLWHYHLIIPDYELDTHKSREVLPKSLSMNDAIFNVSHALALVKALGDGDMDLLKKAAKDKMHEPYRRRLIKDYDLIESLVKAKDGIILLSGSGPTLLAISKVDMSSYLKDSLDKSYKVLSLEIALRGYEVKDV